MSGINIILVSDFLVGFCLAWVLRGILDRLEIRLLSIFKRKKRDV